MMQDLQIFAGSRRTLSQFQEIVPQAELFALRAGAALFVLPLDDDLLDAMHVAYGTGTWLKTGPRLSSGDMAFAARVSALGPLGYIEVCGDDDERGQCAAVWQNGGLTSRPMTLRLRDAAARRRSLWPVNIALKQLGVSAQSGLDEAESFGLNEFYSNDDIKSRAIRVA